MTFEERQDRLKAGRNDPCPCGSGKKYKKCHQSEDEQAVHVELKRREQAAKDAAAAALAAGEDEDGPNAGGKDGGAGGRAQPGDRGRLQSGSGSRDRSLNTTAKNMPRRKAV
jgi:hypothetical protein